MNFDYNEDQQMLKESMQKWFQDNYSFEQRKVVADSDDGFSADHWATYAELGWLSVPFKEEYGGFGGSIIDIAAVMEEYGKVLVLEPIVPNLILFGGLLQNSTNQDKAHELIPQLIDGSLFGSMASYESQARYNLSNIATSASKDGDDYVLNGSKYLVLGGAHANKFIVSARTSGEQADKAGITLFLIDRDAEGVSLKTNALMDGQRIADLTLQNVRVSSDNLISDLDAGYEILDEVMKTVQVALSAEALGIMQTLNTATVEYTKTRKQFGVPISVFQALQHRMVDCFVAQEQCKSLLYGTLCEMTDGVTSAEEVRKTIYGLRALVAKYGKQIGDEAIQMHGGMGMTDELSIGHYVKRLMMINLLYGNGDYFQKRFNEVAYAA